eukprot:Gregarina_sp_Pseudo_9__5672@NODE_802_length_2199_cov_19_615278_g755_i0_p1_GENE_NODE_802_length_2199_cov_19_615278_g755_i0NODE_802_length_2199_cov_19_615278_g755_i0_p1_ORF_typecomplete_len254_score65_33_NODE_802_length_2199_cov_19_615278_g755_i046807
MYVVTAAALGASRNGGLDVAIKHWVNEPRTVSCLTSACEHLWGTTQAVACLQSVPPGCRFRGTLEWTGVLLGSDLVIRDTQVRLPLPSLEPLDFRNVRVSANSSVHMTLHLTHPFTQHGIAIVSEDPIGPRPQPVRPIPTHYTCGRHLRDGVSTPAPGDGVSAPPRPRGHGTLQVVKGLRKLRLQRSLWSEAQRILLDFRVPGTQTLDIESVSVDYIRVHFVAVSCWTRDGDACNFPGITLFALAALLCYNIY